MDALRMACEAVDANCTDERLAATAKGLLEGYDTRWRGEHDDIRVVHVEHFAESLLPNLDRPNPAKSASKTFRLAGLMDKLAFRRSTGDRILFDHKTTSMDIEDPDAAYWRQLVIEGQPSHYDLLLHLAGERVDNVVWDVIRKPTIRPKSLDKKSQAEIASLGTYCGRAVDPAKATLSREDGELFQARLAADCIKSPDKYFQRRSATRSRAELVEYARELWAIGQDLLVARKHGRWYRNSGACMNYGTPCEYLGICSGHDTPDSDKWVKLESVHRELPTTTDDRHLLTNSRVRCFQTCRRKHQLHYEVGLERADGQEREALYFGTLVHTALDAWWTAASGGSDDSEGIQARAA